MKKWQKEMVESVTQYLEDANKYKDGATYRYIPDQVIKGVEKVMKARFKSHNEKKAAKKAKKQS